MMDALALSNNWLIYAWLVPLAWALAAIVDVLLIEWDVYENPLQACAISAAVVSLPLLLVAFPAVNLHSIDVEIAAVGLLSGVCYAFHLLFYYKAMFTANDAAHTETVMNTEIVFVPVLAFVILGEKLDGANYLGIGFAALGVLTLSWGARRYLAAHRRMSTFLVFAVLASSAGFIVEEVLFTLTNYGTGLFFYALGLVLGVLPLAINQGAASLAKRFARYGRIIIVAEVFTLVAAAASMRAIDLGPSVSLVALIESARPLLIMLLCFIVWLPMQHFHARNQGTVVALHDQFRATVNKLMACTLIVCGVFFASVY